MVKTGLQLVANYVQRKLTTACVDPGEKKFDWFIKYSNQNKYT